MSEELQDKQPDPAPGPDNEDKGGGDKTDLSAQLAEMQKALDALQAENAEAKKAVEEQKRASMTEAEKLAADRTALDNERKQLLADARAAAADKLGIIAKALPLVPQVDPRTPEGAKALTDWAKQNPEFIKAAPSAGMKPYEPPSKSALAAVLSGEKRSPYMGVEDFKKLIGG